MHRKSRQNRRPVAVVLSILAALTLVVGAVSLSPATAESAMSPLELARVTQANCQVLLAKATTSAAKTRARQCIADQQVIIDALSSSPSPSPSATQSPSPSPSPTVQPSPTVSPTATTTATPTPTASPTPTVGLKDCLNQLAACGFPNADSTGPTGTLTVVNGDVTLSTAGMTYRDKEVRGCVRVTAPNVVIANVRIVCPDMDHGGDYVRVRNNSTNLTIVDTEIDCVGGYGIAIGSANFTVTRTDIAHCENGFNVDVPGNVVVQDSYVHDLVPGSPATQHTDGMQIGQGASGITLRHNVILSPLPGGSSAVTFWDESGSQNNDMTIVGNLFAGANYTLRCARYDASTNVVITGNRFGPNEAGYDKSNSCVAPHVTTWSGNVVDATGAVLAAA